MKAFLFSILFIFLISINAKENDYSIIIKKNFESQLLDISEDYDREISAVGFIHDYKISQSKQSYTNAFDYLSNLNSNNGIKMQLIKINEYGKIVLDKSNLISKLSKATSIVKTPSNGYFIGGETNDGQLILLKLNYDGSMIFHKTFGTKNVDKLNTIVKLNDGGVLTIGSSVTSRSSSDSLFQTGLGLNDIFITRFSVNGQILWSKKYGTEHDDTAIDATLANDGSIMVVSNTKYQDKNDINIMRIDENGNKIWIDGYKDKKDITAHKIITLRDNNFLLVLSELDDMNKEQIRFIKFDINNNVILDKKIHTKYPSVLNDIKEYSDGAFIGVGYVKDSLNTDALAVIFDSKLNKLYQDHYGDDNYDSFNSIEILHNSQAACAGVFTDNNSQESNMWIVKLNRDTSIAQKSINALSLFEQLSTIYKDELNSKQIEIKKDLSINFLDKRLYFDVSEYKLSKTQEIFFKKFSKKLLPFLHKQQVQISSISINGHSSSEWGNKAFDDSYINNEELSMKRAFSTLKLLFNTQDKQTKKWLSKILKGSGYSYSKKIILNNTEDKEKSRRVSLKINLNETK